MNAIINTGIMGSMSPWVFALLLAWTLPWKGFALWKAAQRSHTWWFIILFVANTFGILDIIYIYFIARKYKIETIENAEK